MQDLRARSLKKACLIVALFSMVLSAAPALAQTVTAMWDPSPSTDQVSSYQVCLSTSPLSCNVALASVGASTTAYTFAPTGGVRYYIAIRANNAAGSSPFSSEVSFSIPSFAQPANQPGTAGVPVAPLTLSISDPDGSPLTITHTGLPVGLSIDSAARRITGSPAAAGTYNVTLYVNDGLATISRSFIWTVTQNCLSIGDLDGDCRADLIWRNDATGQNLVWYFNGSTLLYSGSLPTVTDGNWQIVTRADVNRDGTADLIWRNRSTGQNVVWYLNGTTLLYSASLPSVTDGNWQIVASADFNRDGAPDLIWRNRGTGQNVVWYLNGTTLLSSDSLPTVTDGNWQIVASADFNRDSAPDLIWRNAATGQNVIWYFNGTTLLGSGSLPTVTDGNWQIASSADFNRDGSPDLIWRHRGTGQNLVWYLNGPTLLYSDSLPTVTDGMWKIVGR